MSLFQFDYGDEENNIKVDYVEIENEEVFHMKNLYKMIHDWLIEEGFKTIYDDPNDENPEVFYLEKRMPGEVKEHRIWWRCLRVPGKSSYYRYYLKIDFMTLNMKSIEVTHQGHKMKTDRGDCIIRITAYLQLDYQYDPDTKTGGMRGHPILKNFHKLFKKRIYKAQIEAYKIDLYKTTYRLQNIIKQYLKLKTLYEMPKPFHPEKGL